MQRASDGPAGQRERPHCNHLCQVNYELLTEGTPEAIAADEAHAAKPPECGWGTDARNLAKFRQFFSQPTFTDMFASHRMFARLTPPFRLPAATDYTHNFLADFLPPGDQQMSEMRSTYSLTLLNRLG